VGERRGPSGFEGALQCAILAHNPLLVSNVNQQSLPQQSLPAPDQSCESLSDPSPPPQPPANCIAVAASSPQPSSPKEERDGTLDILNRRHA
jgi:hypothetical protein